MTPEQLILQSSVEACRQRTEKLGAIQSAEAFGTAALLRNKFSHRYPQETAARIERLNLILEEANFVAACFDEIASYLHRKGVVA